MILRLGCVASFGISSGVAAEGRSSLASPVSIASTQHDYDMVKALEVPSEQSKLLLTADQIPLLQPRSEAPPALSLLERQRLDEAKPLSKAPAKNWLLEAMAAKPTAAKKDSRSSEWLLAGKNTDDETTGTNIASSQRPQGAADREKPSLKSGTRPELPVPPNLLAAYMAVWLTPADFALLKPRTETPVEPSSDVRTGGQDTSTRFGMSGGKVDNALAFGDPAPAATSPNPYLLDLAGPSARDYRAPGVQKPVEVKSSEEPVRSFEIPRPDSLSTPPPHDLLRPDDDAKYFKQLKRF